MKSKTKHKLIDPQWAAEMAVRRQDQRARENPRPYIPRSKYEPNKLPNIIKAFRKES